MLWYCAYQVNEGLQTSNAFAGSNTPEAVVVSSSPGSVKVVMHINFYNSSITDFSETKDLLSNSLTNLADNSQGFLSSESITVESTCEFIWYLI